MGRGPQNRPDTFDPHPYPAKLGSDGNNCCSLNGIIVIVYMELAASPRRACGGRRTFGFAERFAAPQRPSAVGVLVLVPQGGNASLRRAITQALRA